MPFTQLQPGARLTVQGSAAAKQGLRWCVMNRIVLRQDAQNQTKAYCDVFENSLLLVLQKWKYYSEITTKVDPGQDQGILLWTLVVRWFYIKKCFLSLIHCELHNKQKQPSKGKVKCYETDSDVRWKQTVRGGVILTIPLHFLGWREGRKEEKDELALRALLPLKPQQMTKKIEVWKNTNNPSSRLFPQPTSPLPSSSLTPLGPSCPPWPLSLTLSHSSAVLRTESSPRILQSSLRRCCISGMPASWASSRCFSSVRERRVAVSSCSKRQPPSPSNCSRWVWYFLEASGK